LLLTLICILFKKRGEFPNKRATVYNEALWTLLSEWDASKEIVRSAPYEGMDTKCKEILLAEIAYDNFVADRLFFQQGEITLEIEQMIFIPSLT
jgi:predicted NACHT family NTPase